MIVMLFLSHKYVFRIEEALLYNRLMATHILPVEHLDVPVVLNSR